MKKRHLSIAELENIAGNELSHFEGPEFSNYDGTEGEWDDFNGASDDLVDFNGDETDPNGGFGKMELHYSKERMFQLKITNATANDLTFYLSDGLDKLTTGTITADGTNAAITGGNITVTSNPQNFKFLRNYFLANPSRVLGFKVSSTDATQLETVMTIETHSPFHIALKTRQIVLASYTNEHTYRDKVVTVPEQFQLDDKTKVKMTIVANSSMTVTFYFGAVLNLSKALHRKAAKSGYGVGSRMGAEILTSKIKRLEGGGK